MRDRLAARRLAVSAAGLVALEAGIGALGGGFPALSAVVLLLAPGLALVPLLPNPITQSRIATLAAAPALGFAATSVALVSVASAGAPLTATVTRAVVASLVVVGFLAFRGGEPGDPFREGPALGAAGLFAAVLAGIVLQERVIGGSPVPGNDWAKYVLYADEIRRQGSLLIDNPFWMLGVPFREDPGTPAVYGAYLALTGQPASVLMHGIWAFAVMAILSTFSFVRAFWGELAAVLAAGFLAVLPISHDILGWHGLANLAALALLPLLLVYATGLITRRLEAREAAGFGLLLIALAATHRLSFVVGMATVAGVVAIGLVLGRARGLLAGGAATAATILVLGGGVAYDLVIRSRTFGGAQDYTAYLSSKMDLVLVAKDHTLVFTAAALVAVGLALRWAIRDRRLVAPLCLLAIVAAMSVAWLVQLPLVYFRMAYFLPVALVPLVAVALVRLLRPRPAAAAGLALALVVAGFAWDQAGNVRRFYAFANPTSLRGLDALAARIEPGEVVVTDRCWSFLGTWLLHTRTLPALEPEDIQPKAEVVRAREAKALLAGTPEGRRLGQRLGVRFLVVDPACADARGRPTRPPAGGEPFFVSERLAVLTLPRS